MHATDLTVLRLTMANLPLTLILYAYAGTGSGWTGGGYYAASPWGNYECQPGHIFECRPYSEAWHY